jgi:hypothetical protein
MRNSGIIDLKKERNERQMRRQRVIVLYDCMAKALESKRYVDRMTMKIDIQ